MRGFSQRIKLNRFDKTKQKCYTTLITFRKGKKMKWILVKKSDGERGNAGLKKIYQVIVEDNKVITLWGKAEDVSAQAKQVKSFAYPFLAKAYANDKVQSKITRGYKVVLVA